MWNVRQAYILETVPVFNVITDMATNKLLVLARHGESEWTKNNLFCGWYDAKLSERG